MSSIRKEKINNMDINCDATYNHIYNAYQHLSDTDLIDFWKHHQRRSMKMDDLHWISFSVCEDLLRQRGNTYIDNNYPKN